MGIRKERKQRAEEKRKLIAHKILQEIIKTSNDNRQLDPRERFRLAMEKGDELIIKMINEKPQEKTLILQAVYRLRDDIESKIKGTDGH